MVCSVCGCETEDFDICDSCRIRIHKKLHERELEEFRQMQEEQRRREQEEYYEEQFRQMQEEHEREELRQIHEEYEREQHNE